MANTTLLTSTLLAGITNKITLPAQQDRFSEANLLAEADDFISSELLPHICNLNLDLLTVTDDIPVVSGQTKYLIPTRAISKVLRSIRYNGGQALGYASLEDSYLTSSGSSPYAVAFQGDYFLPLPTPTSGTFNVAYACSVSSLVVPSKCGYVSNFNLGSSVISLSSVPNLFTITDKYDLVSQDGRILQRDIVPTDITNSNFTFASISSEIQIGDYLCLARQTCVITLPVEAMAVIQGSVCLSVLAAQGDTESYGVAKAQFDSMWKMFKTNMSPKLVNKCPKMQANNLYGNRWARRTYNNRGI